MGLTVINHAGPYFTPTGAYIPSAGETFYVGASQPVGEIGEKITNDRFFTTVNAALNACYSGRGDTVFVLPGYTESIAAADAWSNLGTKTDVSVVGLGRGTNRPAFTWTAAGSTILMDAANFRISNMNMYMAGSTGATAALTVAAPITASAAGCALTDNFIHFGVDADQIVTIGVTTTAAADSFEFKRNQCYGDTAAECTTFLQLVGADNCEIWDNKIQGATSSTTVGTIRFLTTASVGIDFRRCIIQNYKASSVHAVTGMAGVTGTVHQCGFGILDNTTLAGWVPSGAGNGPQFFACYTANLAAESGALTTPVST